jgi:hypothetical protein
MGHIKEPDGVDFIVDSSPLTTQERKRISEIIAHYKATGEKMPFRKSKIESRGQKKHKPLTKAIKHGGRHLANQK